MRQFEKLGSSRGTQRLQHVFQVLQRLDAPLGLNALRTRLAGDLSQALARLLDVDAILSSEERHDHLRCVNLSRHGSFGETSHGDTFFSAS